MLREFTAIAEDTTVSTRTSVLLDRRAILVTLGVYLALSWLPYLGAPLAGVLGGLQSRSAKAALVAALLPGLLNYVFLALLSVISPNLWAERWLIITTYNVLIVAGAVGASLLKAKMRS